MKDFKYYLAAITAFTTWGFLSLMLRPLNAYSSLDILFYRVFSCALIMSIISCLFKHKEIRDTLKTYNSLPGKERYTIALLNISGSIFLTANWFSFIYVMNHVSVRATSAAYLICPFITTLLAFFLLHEKLERLQWLSVILSVIGCLLLFYSDITSMLFSIVIGFSYACYIVSQSRNNGFDKFLVLNFHIVLSALILLPFYPIYSGRTPTAIMFYSYIEIIAVFFTIIPLFLNLYALNRINSSTVGMLLNISPIIAFVLSKTIFHEPIGQLQTFSYVLILLSVIVFNGNQIFKNKRKQVL